jgi:hypothetical protein
MSALSTTRGVIIFAVIGLAYGLITWLFPFVLPEDTVARLVREDSIIEYLTFIFFFIAGLGFLATFFYCKQGNNVFGYIKTKRNFIYLGLAAVLIFGAGEEISWGQRLFGFETPEAMEENEQEEFTVHNLPVFNTVNETNLFQMNRMFIYFWFGFCLMVPLSALVSTRLRDWYHTLGVPVVPLAIGGLFMLNYILSKVYDPLDMVRESYDGRLSELRECQQALLFALVALAFLLLHRGAEWFQPQAQLAEQPLADAQPESEPPHPA